MISLKELEKQKNYWIFVNSKFYQSFASLDDARDFADFLYAEDGTLDITIVKVIQQRKSIFD